LLVAGINSGYDALFRSVDSGGAAMVDEGRIVGAVAEERVTRRKHAGGYRGALHSLMTSLNMSRSDIDLYCISFYGSPLRPPKSLIDYHLKELGIQKHPEKLVCVPSHHLSHAISAFFLSPFETALVSVLDNEGSILLPAVLHPEDDRSNYSWERNSYWYASGNVLHLLDRDLSMPGELGSGKAYNRFTRYIGWPSYHDAGKTMGLSALAEKSAVTDYPDLWSLDRANRLKSELADDYDLKSIQTFLQEHGVTPPPPGQPGSWQGLSYINLAGYIQDQLNKWISARLAPLLEASRLENICVGGGVGLNAAMNSHLQETLGVPVFVPPYPSDEGQALGNAIYGLLRSKGMDHQPSTPSYRYTGSNALGPKYTAEEVRQSLSAASLTRGWEITAPRNLPNRVAQKVSQGQIVGWWEGRSEYGARALGGRSIVADVRPKEVTSRLNAIKGREQFRPFAPSVLAEHARDYFEWEGADLLLYHMSGIVNVREDKRAVVPGITHADGTTRPQLVKASSHTMYRKLLEEFYSLTGVPLILNTSFNYAGEPIVETPWDALKSAERMGIEHVVVAEFLCSKRF
jgi:carbamoyltransferase